MVKAMVSSALRWVKSTLVEAVPSWTFLAKSTRVRFDGGGLDTSVGGKKDRTASGREFFQLAELTLVEVIRAWIYLGKPKETEQTMLPVGRFRRS